MADDSKMPSPPEIDETPTKQDESMEGGKRSAWMVHVMKTKRAHKGKSLAQVLKMAAKTYKKSGKKTARKTRKGKKFLGMFGGGVAETAAMVGGRRRRGSRKGSRKH
jgi:hypothetical protein